MGSEMVWLGWIVACAWMVLLIYAPLSDIRRLGSVRAWLLDTFRHPLEALGGVMVWVAIGSFVLWMQTDGRWPVQLALFAIPGFLCLFIGRRAHRR